MKKFYKITLDVVSPEEMNVDGARKLLGNKGSFENKEDILWELKCSDSKIFLEVLELLFCYSCGYSAEEYEDMKNNPDKYFDTEIAA